MNSTTTPKTSIHSPVRYDIPVGWIFLHDRHHPLARLREHVDFGQLANFPLTEGIPYDFVAGRNGHVKCVPAHLHQPETFSCVRKMRFVLAGFRIQEAYPGLKQLQRVLVGSSLCDVGKNGNLRFHGDKNSLPRSNPYCTGCLRFPEIGDYR